MSDILETPLYLVRTEPETLYSFEGMHILQMQRSSREEACRAAFGLQCFGQPSQCFGTPWDGEEDNYGAFAICYERTFVERLEALHRPIHNITNLPEVKRTLVGMLNVLNRWLLDESHHRYYWSWLMIESGGVSNDDR